jgi:hypothetical protein
MLAETGRFDEKNQCQIRDGRARFLNLKVDIAMRLAMVSRRAS